MDDLLQLQIQESCKLALPNGLKELMYDISREVLRAQPTNLCEFITNYLSALLITRENIQVASKVCDDICENICYMGLGEELRNIGLYNEDIKIVKEVISAYFVKEHVSETNIMRELLSKTAISEDQIESIQDAIQSAFKRYQAYNTTVFETSSESEMSDSTRAARHTIRLYRATKPTEQEYEKAAGTVQAAYRAYGVRRRRTSTREMDSTLPDDISDGRPAKSLRFGSDDDLCSRSIHTGSLSEVNSNMTEKTEDIFVSRSANKPANLATDSSISLAGSLVQPVNKPYRAHDTLQEENETEFPEKEHSNVDYTLIDSDRMGTCYRTDFIEDNVTCAEDSEASIEDLDKFAEMEYIYVIDELDGNIVAEGDDSFYESKDKVQANHTLEEENDGIIARDGIIESGQNGDVVVTRDQTTDGIENEDVLIQDHVIDDDIKFDADDIIGDGFVDSGQYGDIILTLDENALDNIEKEGTTIVKDCGRTSEDKDEIDSIAIGIDKQDGDSTTEIKNYVDNIMAENIIQSDQSVTGDDVVSRGDNDNKHGDVVENVDNDANQKTENDLLETHDSFKSIDAKSRVQTNSEPSRQYFHVEELNGAEKVELEHSTVPKTPFHSLTNFGKGGGGEEEEASEQQP